MSEQRGYITNQETLYVATSSSLQNEIDEYYTWGTTGPSASSTQKFYRSMFPITICRWFVQIATGAHDAEITETIQIELSATTKIITIPASAGSAQYINTDILSMLQDDTLAFKNEGGGGTGSTVLQGYWLGITY